ncbi:MAG: glycosyltransferase family 4 protein [Alphaproteobacteria bacterium]|nr:glycosyltransferase family 4 protein [Alphaproteobacteria bacterium]
MNLLFVHQNMPGQFRHLAAHLARQPDNRVFFLTRREDVEIAGVTRVVYRPARGPSREIHHYLIRSEDAVLHGQAVARAVVALKGRGFVPDLVVAHSGWGEALFLRDILPRTPILSYCEFYYRAHGADMGFDPAEPPELDAILRARARNAHLLLSLEACDRGWSPTHWQKSVHPAPFHPRISVVHEGIDTESLAPDPLATFLPPDGKALRRGDEVVTYVARNLEPYRGFPTLIRALPAILAERPAARVVIVGGDQISYGSPPREGGTWRERMLAEVPLVPDRVHFVGRLPYDRFAALMKVSAVHVYLTYPFVLSWSMLEAMAAGAAVVGSATAPVEEVIHHNQNGLLADFFSPEQVAERVCALLADRERRDALAAAGRRTVQAGFDLRRCLPAQLALLRSMVGFAPDR